MSDDHHYSRAEALRVARRFDLVVAMPVAFAHHLAAMRSVNPDLRVLTYANATLATAEDSAGLPESAFAHGRDGRRIISGRWGTRLMEPSSPAWRWSAVRQCDERAGMAGYDGCLVDMLTLGIFSRGLVDRLPVVPGTGRVYTEAEYREQLIDLGGAYDRLRPRLDIVGNSVENGYRYWRAPVRSRSLARSLPAAQMEDFLRGARDRVDDLPTGADWRRDVRVVEDLERTGGFGLFTTKLWVGASPQQVARWQAYAMSTFLLGAGGQSYLAFTSRRDQAGATATTLPYRMPRIGKPLEPRRRLETGASVRPFSGGLVVVNPTRHVVRLTLDKPHRTLRDRVVSRLRLAPATGQVLRPASANG